MEFLSSEPGRFFQLVKTEESLDDCSFLHEELQLGVSRISFEAPVTPLYVNCCQYWATRATELELRVSKLLPNLLLVDDATKKVGVREHIKFLIREVDYSKAVDVSKRHVVTANVLFKLVNDLLNGSPLCDIGFFKGNELLLSVYHFTLLDDELRLVNVAPHRQSSQGVAPHRISIVLLEGLLIVLEAHLRLLTRRRAVRLVHKSVVIFLHHNLVAVWLWFSTPVLRTVVLLVDSLLLLLKKEAICSEGC